MLFKGLDRLKRSVIMTTIILMFVGNILLILPEEYIPMLGSALGFALLVWFVLAIFNFLGSSRALIHYIYLAVGLFIGICGVMLLVFDNLLVMVLSWLVGTLPIVAGFYGVYHAFAFARRSGRRGWWILVLLSSCLIVFGGVVFWNPWMENTHAVMQVTGGAMMYSAFVSALSLIWIWPIRKN